MWVLSGQIGLYVLTLLSLIWHELGHVVFAKICKVRVLQITLLPFGGRIQLAATTSYKERIMIAVGGPLFTWFAYVCSAAFPPVWALHWQQIQLVLLVINCLPFYPLDGGQIVWHSLLAWRPTQKNYELFLSLSFYFFTIIVVVTLLMLPQSLILAVLSLLLWSEVMGEWKIRKYRSAYEKIVMNRLT